MGKENAIYRIYPMRVEEVISQNTAVKHCCVVGKRNADKGYVLIAFISLYNDLNNIKENDVEKELRGACNSKFSADSRPVEYIFRDELPITGAGKVDYRNLEKCIMEEYDYGF